METNWAASGEAGDNAPEKIIFFAAIGEVQECVCFEQFCGIGRGKQQKCWAIINPR